MGDAETPVDDDQTSSAVVGAFSLMTVRFVLLHITVLLA